MFGKKPPAPPPVQQDQKPDSIIASTRRVPEKEPAAAPQPQPQPQPVEALSGLEENKKRIRQMLFTRIDVSTAAKTTKEVLQRDIEIAVNDIVTTERMRISFNDTNKIVQEVLDDMFGVGPIEVLLADDGVSDIMVNGPNQVYVERNGRLELTNVRFRDDDHVINMAQRIASSIGRRVDETSPMVDARLADGSRVNVVLPPLAVKGPSISIRKFSRTKPSLAKMVQQGNLSGRMNQVLSIASACRLNVIIVGGTGSGKTTMMNALSAVIDPRERIVTIEDAVELQLQQPHVVVLETRPPNSEGLGEVTQRDLMRNALRMRPDRIILGETRGVEAFDVLQAMNTGHDGSMTTLHANNPRDALVRLENMLLMGAMNQPLIALRRQIVGAVNLLVQLERMRDGKRRVTHITEVIGLEEDVVITQDLFTFEYDASQFGDEVKGVFRCSGLRPKFLDRASYYGLSDALMEAMTT